MNSTRTHAVVFAVALLFTVCLAETPAEAKGRKSLMTATDIAPDTDAQATVKLRGRGEREKVKIKASHLEPNTQYEVMIADTAPVGDGELLAEIETNRKGIARVTIKVKDLPEDAPATLQGIEIVICERGSEEPVLVGTVPGDAPEVVEAEPPVEEPVGEEPVDEPDEPGEPTGNRIGFLTLADGKHEFAEIVLVSAERFGEQLGFFMISEDPVTGPLMLRIADGTGTLVEIATIETSEKGHSGPKGHHDLTVFELYLDLTSDDFPLEIEGAEDLSGRPFEIIDADGNVLFEGELPELQDMGEFDC